MLSWGAKWGSTRAPPSWRHAHKLRPLFAPTRSTRLSADDLQIRYRWLTRMGATAHFKGDPGDLDTVERFGVAFYGDAPEPDYSLLWKSLAITG